MKQVNQVFFEKYAQAQSYISNVHLAGMSTQTSKQTNKQTNNTKLTDKLWTVMSSEPFLGLSVSKAPMGSDFFNKI